MVWNDLKENPHIRIFLTPLVFRFLRRLIILFQKKDGADGSLDGTITREELEEIYEMYEVGKIKRIILIQQGGSNEMCELIYEVGDLKLKSMWC